MFPLNLSLFLLLLHDALIHCSEFSDVVIDFLLLELLLELSPLLGLFDASNYVVVILCFEFVLLDFDAFLVLDLLLIHFKVLHLVLSKLQDFLAFGHILLPDLSHQ